MGWFRHWFLGQFRQFQVCRQCGKPAGFLDDVCDFCGSAHPVHVPLGSTLALALLSLLAILAISIIH
jgi:predicted amidophosphoribosyltransferase